MESSAFFNSNSGDRIYDASDFASFFSNLISNGVCYTLPDNLMVTPGTGMKVKVNPGSAWINGYTYWLDASYDLTLTTAHGAQPRIDRVVLRWSLPNRAIYLMVITGAPNPQPAPPALTRNSETYDLCLADILIPAAAINIATNNITDTRTNPALCGLVNSLVAAVYQ
jgi:hypothetical protein